MLVGNREIDSFNKNEDAKRNNPFNKSNTNNLSYVNNIITH